MILRTRKHVCTGDWNNWNHNACCSPSRQSTTTTTKYTSRLLISLRRKMFHSKLFLNCSTELSWLLICSFAHLLFIRIHHDCSFPKTRLHWWFARLRTHIFSIIIYSKSLLVRRLNHIYDSLAPKRKFSNASNNKSIQCEFAVTCFSVKIYVYDCWCVRWKLIFVFFTITSCVWWFVCRQCCIRLREYDCKS